MRQLIQTFLIDMRMSARSFMAGFVVIVPTIVLVILRSFIPSVESTSATFAVVVDGPNAVEPGLIAALDEFADVFEYDTIDAMEQKLRGTGTVEGLYWDPDASQYVSVVERTQESNTVFSNGARVVRKYVHERSGEPPTRITHFSYGVPPELSDRTATSPVAVVGGAIFFAYISLMFGFLIGLALVNDKEEGTDRAIKVTPVTKFDYFVGHSIFPFLLTLLFAIVGLLGLRLGNVNMLQTYTATIASFSITLLIGLLLGGLGSNENEAIGIGKLIGMLLGLSILGGTLLPDNWMWAVWWSPVYWAFSVMRDIFSDTATWALVGWKSAVVVGLVGLYFILLRKKIIKGLS
jgi:ABC-2 type transport system permease protein